MRSALGKGLSALISDETAASVSAPAPKASAPVASGQPLRVPVEKLVANPNQPRKTFTEESLSELAESLKAHGIVQPIVVAPLQNDKHEIIAGERRWRAAQRAGIKEVPVVIYDGTEAERFQIALIENIQRSDLNAMELARGYQRLSGEFGMTQEAIAKSVGKDRAVVANTLRLLNLASEIQQAVEEGALSAAHARTLAGLESRDEQLQLFKQIMTDQLNVREVEHAVRSRKGRKSNDTTINSFEQKAIEVRTIEEEMQTHLTRKVELHETDKKSHKGWLKLEFYSLEDLDNLLARLKKS